MEHEVLELEWPLRVVLISGRDETLQAHTHQSLDGQPLGRE